MKMRAQDDTFGKLLSLTIAVMWATCTQAAWATTGVPAIQNVSPLSGPSGTVVTIAGANFNPTASSNMVFFGAVQASVLAATATNLTVTVPVSATFAPVTVTVGGLTARANLSFLPTFTGNGSGIVATNFGPSFNLSTPNGPLQTVIADLDGDGKPDLIVLEGNNGNILSIFRNISTNGTLSASSFAPQVDLPIAGSNPGRMAVADLDGDGKLDIILTDDAANLVSVYHNHCTPGNISSNAFDARVDFAAGGGCFGVAVADLDGDGKPEIVTGNDSDGTISIFYNTSTVGSITTNSFAPRVDFPMGPGCQGVAISDLNGDGQPDVVGVDNDGTLAILQNLITVAGSITTNSFSAPIYLSMPAGGVSVTIVDLDGDGNPDLAVTSYLPQTLSIFRNLGAGGNLTTNSFAPRVDFGLDGRGHTIAVGDLDGDGKPDLAVDAELNSLVSLFDNLSTPGSFTSSSLAPQVELSTGWNAWGISVGDLDGDGRPDFVFANSYDGNLQIYQNLTPFGTSIAPAIAFQPTNLTVAENGTAVFNVAATGTQPVTYQWFFNGAFIPGAAAATLTLTNVQPAQAGIYSVLVSNLVGAVVSSNAVLTVNVPPTPPTILAQSPSQLVALGTPATFSVTAIGSGPLSYFWSRNGTLIPNATNSSYVLASAQLSDSGSDYSCLVTNAFGSASSTNATLKVLDVVANSFCSGAILITNAPYTNQQSTVKAGVPGNPVPDCVDGFGHGVWYEFTAPWAGLLVVDTFGSDFDTGLALYTGSCDALTEVACNDDFNGPTSQVTFSTTADTTYMILAGGYEADAGNLTLHLNYFIPPTFVVAPTNLVVGLGSNALFSPTVVGSLPMNFQWYFNNTPLVDGGRVSGSTNLQLAIANVQINDGGNYQLVASNFIGVTTSSVAVLAPIILPPTIVQAPLSQSVGQGSNVTFTAVAGGTPPFSYQWSFNGSLLVDDGIRIAGSATSTLTISNLTSADAGGYSLTITNVSGSAGASATLTVLTPPVITQNPIGRSVPPGLPTVFTAFASGIPAASYQWQLNGTNIPGATSLVYSNTVGANTLGYYQLVASNLMGVAVSSPAQLTFGPVAAWGSVFENECLPPPGLSNVIAVAGNSGASFAVLASGNVVAWGGGVYTNIPIGVSNVVAMTSDNSANYALRADGTVVSWANAVRPGLSNIVSLSGLNSYGVELALRAEGTITNYNYSQGNFTFPPGLNHVTAIAAGYNFALALRTNGTVALAFNTSVTANLTPVTNVPPSVNNVIAIAAGHDYAMALKADGTVVAWGSGSGTNLPPGMTNITAIAAGNAFENSGLATRSDGAVFAWGDNLYGETHPPAALANLVVSGLATPPYHGLALVNNGSPQIVQPPVGLTADAGRDVTLQARVAGAAPLSYQWLLNGTNVPGATNASLFLPAIQPASAGNYQLFASNAFNTALSVPAPVNVITNYTLQFLSQGPSSLTTYQGATIALDGFTVLGDGPLHYQWFFAPTNSAGRGGYVYAPVPGATNDTLTMDPALAGQSGSYYLAVSNQFTGISYSPGNAGLTSAPVNVQVLFAKAWGYLPTDAPFVLTNATAIAVGNYGSLLTVQGDYFALSSAGKISSWAGGPVLYGETNFSALSNSIVMAIAAGYGDTLALKSDGTLFALGGAGQVSGPTIVLSNIPSTAVGITAIACGDYHDLALRWDGTVVGWGQNIYGQATNSVTNAVAIAAGGDDSIALRADGSVVTWGMYGSLPPYGQFLVPATATNVVAVAAGGSHFLALRANGTVVGWGNNSYGATTIPASWTNIVAIAAGYTHSTALRNDGTVLAIGGFEGFVATNYLPSDLSNVVAIAASGNHNLALFGNRAPSFTVQPWNRTVFNTTTSVWFSAKCSGVQPMHYQWQFNGTNVPGATNDQLTINASNSLSYPRVTYPLQSGFYRLVASNAYGVVASKYAQLSVIIPLATAVNATNQSWTTSGSAPWFGETNVTHDGVAAAQSGNVGILQDSILQTTVATNVPGNYTFWWNVSSEPDLDYLEFRINGMVQTSISGQTGWQQVNIPVAAGTNVLMWRYSEQSVYASGQNAGWLDQFAFVPAPVILSQPASVTSYAGTTAAFSIVINNLQDQTFGFQWQKNGVNLVNGGNVSGAQSPRLTLSNVQDAAAASYTVIVTNSAGGSVTSSAATLTVLDTPPTIASLSGSLTNLAGTTATFNVSATGSSPMYFQWLKNGISLPTGIASTLTLTNVQDADAAIYSVIITNAYGSATSAPIQLTIIDRAPVITSQPANAWVVNGGSASFAVSAVGTTPMSYQWQFDGTNLSQATNASLLLSNVSKASVGNYQVIITNASGSTNSAMASLGLVHSQVVAWGDNTYGQTNVPAIPTNVVAIAGGMEHSLALQTDGNVVAWGNNTYGQASVPGLSNVVAIAGGAYLSLALHANGTVSAWGLDGYGETEVPAGLSNAVAIAAGYFHSLALRSNGTVVAWGYDADGEINVPASLTNAVAIAAGWYHNLALQANGTVVAWGDDTYGETDVPVGLSNVVAIAAGAGFSLALQANGTVVAWGDDADGETDVPGLTNAMAIAAGGLHALALQASGTVVAWGEDVNSQTIVPAGLTNAVAIAGGGYHSLAIINDGSPWILTQPVSQTVASNTTVQFVVTALNASTLAYQWQRNGVNLSDGGNVSGSATASLTLSNVQTADMAVYTVLITNAIDQITSAPATLLVLGPPQITLQPVSQTVNGGATVQFTVAALGSPSPAYQWWWNGTNWAGFGASLTLTNTMRAQEGTYSVLVTNGVGGVFSSNAVLRVLVPQQLGQPVLRPDGTLQFTSSDVGGGALPSADLSGFEAQASSNLLTWVTLPNALILSNGTLVLQDRARTNNPSRFYRIVEH